MQRNVFTKNHYFDAATLQHWNTNKKYFIQETLQPFNPTFIYIENYKLIFSKTDNRKFNFCRFFWRFGSLCAAGNRKKITLNTSCLEWESREQGNQGQSLNIRLFWLKYNSIIRKWKKKKSVIIFYDKSHYKCCYENQELVLYNSEEGIK